MLRPVIDIAMIILLLLSMAWETVGPAFAVLCEKFFAVKLDGYEIAPFMHEAIGSTLIVLFCWHLWLNRYWFKNIFKGRYNATRALNAIMNIFLIIDVTFLLISGVMMSKSVFVSLGLNTNLDFARTAHILASYWGYVIMSFHVGLYWHIMTAMMKIKRTENAEFFSNITPHILAVFIMIYGVFAFIKRQLGDYMLLKSQFVFFDFEEPLIYFLLDYIAIMILFACLGHYLILLFRKLKI